MFHKSSRASRGRRTPSKSRSASRNFRRIKLSLESLEKRELLSVNPIISEFMASNQATLTDYYGENPDWLEVYNPDIVALNLSGWKLKCDDDVWTVPANVTIPANGYLKIICDDRNEIAPNGELHTNFKLGASGDYLGLLKPDNTVVSEYAPEYPQQYTDVSYGFVYEAGSTSIISTAAGAKGFVPTTSNGGSTLGEAWKGGSEPFGDSGWSSGTTGVGMASTVAPIASANLKLRLNAETSGGIVSDTSGAGHSGTNAGASWVASATDTAAEPLTRGGAMQFNAEENDQVTVSGGIADFYNASQGAFSFWMRSSGTFGSSGDGAVLLDLRSNRGMLVTQTDSGQIRVRCYQNGTTVNDILSNVSVSDNQWHHITVTFNRNSGATCTIYLDGQLDRQGSNSSSWTWSTTFPLEIGRCTRTDHTPSLTLKNYNGYLDDLRFYNAALTTMQIADIARGADESVSSLEVGLNLQGSMPGINASAFIRVPFTISDPASIDNLLLSIRYNDGFIAWINGVQVAQGNAPTSPAWNSAATDIHSPGRMWQGLFEEVSNLNLHTGTNILAIQGLNYSVSDPSFLIMPQLSANVISVYGTEGRYFASPTPGALNGSGTADLGPIVSDVSRPAVQPAAGAPIVVTARVAATLNPLQTNTATLHYRAMYSSEYIVTMYDDGAHGDGASGDGVYGATIPAGTASAGQMIRWYVTAIDDHGHLGRWPILEPTIGTDSGPEYEGTVIANPSMTSTLPIIQTFAATPSLMDDWNGTRGSVFYLGEFYDNVFMRRRGGYSTLGNKIDFNSGYDFKFAEDEARVNEINLNQHILIGDKHDPSYTRATVAFETFDEAGSIANIAFPIRVQRNGAYAMVSTFVEQTDKNLLKREGLYENSAIYKGYDGSMSATNQFEKKTRKEEAGAADLQSLINGLHLADAAARKKYIYDNVDIPAVLNYLAANVLVENNDQAGKNFFVYRDTNDGNNALFGYANSNGTNEWGLAPWDEDLTFGINWGITDYMLADPQAHPFFSDSDHPKNDGPVHWMTDVFLDIPELKQMYLRRLRTLMDELLQPLGTTYGNRFFEQEFDRLYTQLNGDSALRSQVPNLQTLINDIKTKYLDARRTHLFIDHGLNTSYTDHAGIPLTQAENLVIQFGAYEVCPASGNQDEEYLTLINPGNTAVDLSGWKLTGGIELTFKKGVIIPAGGTLYVSPNVYVFRQRATGPSGNQGLLLQGNYDGHLSKWGEILQLQNPKNEVVATLTIPSSNPSPAQQYLRITEVMFHPAEPTSGTYTSDDFQFLELKNTSTAQTLNLTGVRFTDGVIFNFTGSGVTSLAPGGRVLVVSNLTAFRSRYGTGLNGIIAGQFAKEKPTDLSITHLSNSGEKITLVDSVGETIQSFSYEDDWFKQADGKGNSLVIRDPAAADRDSWGRREGWFASHAANGSPGADETPDYAVDAIVVNEILSHTDIANPGDWVEFYNTTGSPINIGGWYLSEKDSDLKKYQIAAGTVIPAYGYVTFNHHDHFGNSNDPGYFSEIAFDEYGGTVYLTSASGGVLTTYQVSEKFGDNDRDRDGTYPYHGNPNVTFSFGRYIKSTGGKDFVAAEQSTYNAPNSAVRVGPVVINEINYNPSAGHAEYLELKNVTAQTINLFDPDHADPENPALKNTWRLNGGIEFSFPQGATIPASGYALVVDSDPTWFRTRYNVPASVPIYGPFLHNLSNGGDSVELERAGEPDDDPTKPVPYYRVDQVTYGDGGLWPKTADGYRASLNRVTATAYGDDVANWTAGRPTPGTDYAAYNANPIALTTPATATPGTVVGKTTNLSVLASSVNGSSYLLYNWTCTAMPAGAPYPTFGANGTNAARNSIATFGMAGNYTFTVRITDTYGESITSSVNVVVGQTATGLYLLPNAPLLVPSSQQQFAALYADQFGNRMSSQPATVTWSVSAGTITAGGLYTAPASAATVTVTGVSGSFSGTASVKVGNPQGYWKLNETSGTSAADSSGSGYAATLSGGGTWTNGLFANGLTFNGTNARLRATLNVSETAFGVSLWFKTTSANTGLFEVANNTGSSRDRCLYLTNGNLTSYLYYQESISTSGLNLADGQWHNVVYTFGGTAGGQKLYVDGVLRASGNKASSNFTSDTGVFIGYTDFAAQPYFQGTMDEVRVFNMGLSAANAAYLANLPPTNISLSNTALAENQSGTVGTLTTTSINASDPYAYVLLTDSSNKLEISGATLKLKEGQSLDFESMPSVNLTIRTYNSGGLYFDKAFTINVTDAVEPLVVTPANWTAAGTNSATLKLTPDGKLHVYKTGTTTDMVPPHLAASTSGIDVTGRGTSDLLIVDSMNADMPSLAVHNATLSIARNNAIPSGTSVTIDGGVLNFNGYTDTIGNLIVKNNGQATISAISNQSTTVESGTLTATSIVCDTLTIGTVTSAVAGTNQGDGSEAAIAEATLAKNAEEQIVASDAAAFVFDEGSVGSLQDTVREDAEENQNGVLPQPTNDRLQAYHSNSWTSVEDRLEDPFFDIRQFDDWKQLPKLDRTSSTLLESVKKRPSTAKSDEPSLHLAALQAVIREYQERNQFGIADYEKARRNRPQKPVTVVEQAVDAVLAVDDYPL